MFLAALGLAGLAAFGVSRLAEGDGEARRRLAIASAVTVLVLAAAFFLALPVFGDRGLRTAFVRTQFLFEFAPVVLLGVAAAARVPAGALAGWAVFLLCGQRFVEMQGVYPTLPAASLAPALPGLAAIPRGGEPVRIAAAGTIFRPNGAALYGLEDVRGYESLVLDRFADTYPLWCRSQPASFNLVTRLDTPFLSFLNVRYAIGGPADPVPAGWNERTRNAALAVFENPRALPRAFVPRMLRGVPEPRRRLEEMARERDFAGTAWIGGSETPEMPNGDAALAVRAVGPDLHVSADVAARAFVATSLPDWPGWKVYAGGTELPRTTVNHAFLGFWLEPGRHAVRVVYRPASFTLGLAAFAAGVAGVAAAAIVGATRRRRPS